MIDNGQFVWLLEGLIFDTKGQCAQGQHRACGHDIADYEGVLSFHVTFNAPDYVAPALDCGKSRSLSDFIRRIYGIENSNSSAPVVKRVHFGYEGAMPKLMPTEVIELWPSYQRAIELSCEILKGHTAGITSGSMKGALARALMIEEPFPLAVHRGATNEALLREFGEKMLNFELIEPGSDDWLKKLYSRVFETSCAGASNQLRVYALAQRVLKGWLYMEKTTSAITASTKELFPLPESVLKMVQHVGRRSSKDSEE